MMNKTSLNIYVIPVLKLSHGHFLPLLEDVSLYTMLAIIFQIICYNCNLLPISFLTASLYLSSYFLSHFNIVY